MRRRATKPVAKSSALRRLGLAAPPPFVGRARELAALERYLDDARLAVVTGAVGSGKTRLAHALAGCELSLRASYVSCEEGDRESALLARAERALDVMPGSLAAVMQREPRLLLIDDLHKLPPHDAARVLASLTTGAGAGRVVAFTRDALPLARNDQQRRELALEGLDEAAARELWAHLEELYGPTPASACDDAIARTRGMPLALRREYARALAGEAAWTIAELDDDARGALRAAAVLALPAAPAAIAALVPGVDAEAALAKLVSLQLLDPQSDGRFAIHDIVRDEVLADLDDAGRRALERDAADLILDGARALTNKRGPSVDWAVREGAALGLLDPVDRMREGVRRLLAAGEVQAAIDRLVADEHVVARRGCGGELFSLVDGIAAETAEQRDALDRLRVVVADRHGRVAEALELIERLPQAGAMESVIAARLAYRSGAVAPAEEALRGLVDHADADVRGLAAAQLCELLVARGHRDDAKQLVVRALDADRAVLGERARVRLGLALASAEMAAGRTTAARAALSRAASSAASEPALQAAVAARLAGCLVFEGRLADAEASLAEAEVTAREADEVAVAEEIRRRRAVVEARRGGMIAASETLRALVDARRHRGDEFGALRAEIDLASVLERRGEVSRAAELAAACAQSASRRGLCALALEAMLVSARADASELRLDEAEDQLGRIIEHAGVTADVHAKATALLRVVQAWKVGHAAKTTAAVEAPPLADDEIESARIRSSIALAAGDIAQALDSARSAAVWAERAGRMAEVADALSLAARMYIARGDKLSANAAATRAVREARACGYTRAQARGLLVLAALRRDAGDPAAALQYARDAAELSGNAGLAFERLVAAEAIAVMDDSGDRDAAEARDAAAATMSAYAIGSAQQALADLGLTAARPYRVVDASGGDMFVADANPGVLRIDDRNLAIDGVREVIVRSGDQIADLRRRSLLKRLLFLFAAAPSRTFSKEEIVQTVWEVEYHPLRHDAALFTNIMRIRRLLGKDGADLIRVSEDGYRFVPPSDFLYVEPVADA